MGLRVALRSLLARPVFTLTVVLTLGLCIGVNTSIFSVVNSVLLKPFPFSHSERLMVLSENNPAHGIDQDAVSAPNFRDWREENRTFQTLAAWETARMVLTGLREPLSVRAARVTADLSTVLGVSPLEGRSLSAQDTVRGAAPVAVISDPFWRRQLDADPRVVGRVLELDGERYTVVGVMRPGFQFPYRVDVWVPEIFSEEQLHRRGSVFLNVIGRLRPGVSLDQARADLTRIARRIVRDEPSSTGNGVNVVSLSESAFHQIRLALFVLLAAVGFVLLIGCANVAGLQLARGVTREREVAIRMSLGAGHSRLLRELLAESLLLSLLGALLGLLLSAWIVPLLVAASPADIPRLDESGIDGRVIAFTFALTVLTAFLFGLAPALQLTRTDLQHVLKEGGAKTSAGTSQRRWRSALVVVEVSLAVVLLICALLMLRSFQRLQHVDLGLRPQGLLAMEIELPRARYAERYRQAEFFRRLLERLAVLPGVSSAAATSVLPLGEEREDYDVFAEDRPKPQPGEEVTAGYSAVSPGFIRTAGIHLLRGREIAAGDAANAPPVVIVNERLANRLWPGRNPLGRRLQIGRKGAVAREVVGLVANVRHVGLGTTAGPEVYVSFLQSPAGQMAVLIRAGGDLAAMEKPIASTVWQIDGDQPLPEVRTMTQVLSASTAKERFGMALLSCFALLALVLSGLGLYGVVAETVAQRTHEIGVRMALGAKRARVFRLMLHQGLLLCLAGIAAGLVLAAMAGRLLRGLLFGVSAIDAVTFFAVPALLLAVGLLACFVPAYRATRVDPMISLRAE